MKKKKPTKKAGLNFSRLTKGLLIMNLSMLCMLVFSVQIFASSSTYAEAKKLNLQVENATVEEVITQIQKQSEFEFFYNHELLNQSKKRVNLDIKNETIHKVLDQLFDSQKVTYTIDDRHIIIVPLKTEQTEKEEDAEDSGSAELQTQQQEIEVSGTVTDEQTGDPLPGVNIVVQGTTTGTTTDMDGEYSIEAPADATLVFSFVGYQEQTIEISGRQEIDVAMQQAVTELEEVVAVGYGTQRRVNLTGSITQVQSEELEEISTEMLSQSLQGKSPGVFIRNQQGMPGKDNMDFSIRGFGDPLFIVDGTPVSQEYFQQLESENIASLNVLKDASAAAVYGARAGNGVVLIETKRGTVSEPTFNIESKAGVQFFTIIPDYVSSAEYAKMQNVGRMNSGESPRWSQEEIQKFEEGTDPDYPSVDWWDKTLKDYAPTQDHNISVTGGTESVQYFASANYYRQKGFLETDAITHQRFSLRGNLDVQLTDKFNMGLDLSFKNQNFEGPGPSFQYDISARISRARPFMPFRTFLGPEKRPAAMGQGATMNPYLFTIPEISGFERWEKLFGFAKVNFNYELPYGFEIRANYDLNRRYYDSKHRILELRTYDYEDGEYIFRRSKNPYDELDQESSVTKNINQQYFLTWDGAFQGHEVSSRFIFERLAEDYEFMSGYRRNFNFELPYLFAGSEEGQQNYGYATQDGRKSLVGRINYNYLSKYLFEFSFRYDGSPSFPPDKRWGFFPSVSAGWRLSEESFMQLPFLDNLKLRFSHGLTGYDAAGNFQYLRTYQQTSQYVYGGNELSPGLSIDALPNPNITWEKMITTNAGLDFNLWNNALAGSFDYFYRLRSDVLGTRHAEIPNMVGAVMPEQNIEEYDNRGFELILRHRNNTGEFNYRIEGNVAYNREKTVYVSQPEYSTMEAYRRGNEIGRYEDDYWVYPTDGLFQSQEEIDNWADIDGQNNATIKPGDIKWVDYNEDGRITSADQIIAGRGGASGAPRLMYGLNLSGSWQGFNVEMLWQGAGMYNLTMMYNRDLMHPFWANNQPTKYMYNNMYTPDNEWREANTEDAKWPRYGTDAYNRNHPNYTWAGTEFWLSNGAYLRLKNVRLGYTIPNRITNRWGINELKFYISAYNLLTISEYDFIDPEQYANYDLEHPPTGNINLGIRMEF